MIGALIAGGVAGLLALWAWVTREPREPDHGTLSATWLQEETRARREDTRRRRSDT